MTDRDVERMLNLGDVKAVLLVRGGWYTAPALTIFCRFPADSAGPALWQITTWTDSGEYELDHYTPAEGIVGISIRRWTHAVEKSQGEDAESGAGA